MPATAPTALPVMQMIVALVAVLVMIAALAWAARRVQGGRARASTLLHAHASLSLGPRERAVLVEAAGEFLLLGVASGQVRLLHRYATPPPLPAPTSASAGDFLAQLRASLRASK